MLFLFLQKKREFTGPCGRVTCVAWTPDSQLLACGGLDTNLFIYNMDEKKEKIQIRGEANMKWLTN